MSMSNTEVLVMLTDLRDNLRRGTEGIIALYPELAQKPATNAGTATVLSLLGKAYLDMLILDAEFKVVTQPIQGFYGNHSA